MSAVCTLTAGRALIDHSPARPPRSNFHNYTLFKPYNDKAVKRYMMDISVDEPEVYGNTEWISIKIHGQSFMLHQIVIAGLKGHVRDRALIARPHVYSAKWSAWPS